MSRPQLIILGAIIAACFVGALVSWGVGSAQGSSPDDDFHLASIWCADGPQANGVCAPTGRPSHEKGVVMLWVPENVAKAPCYAGDHFKSAECVTDLTSRLVRARSNAGVYPTGFYKAMHWFVGSEVGPSVLWMRVFNSLLAALFLGAAMLLSGPALRRAGALAWAVGILPLGAFLIPSTNPSSWSIIGLGTLWIFALQFLRGTWGWRTALAGVGAIASFALAILARTDSSAYAGVILVACAIIAFGGDGWAHRLRFLLPAGILVVAAYEFVHSGGASTATNGIATPEQGILPGGFESHLHLLQSAYGQGSFSGLLTNLYDLPGLPLGAFGQGWGLGWLDTPLPALVGLIMCGAVALVVARGVVQAPPIARIGLALVGASCLLIPLILLERSHAAVGQLIQPRYIYPLLFAGIGIALATGPVEGAPHFRFSPRQIGAIVIGLAVANAYSLHTNIQRYVSSLTLDHFRLTVGEQWWWHGAAVSPMVVWLLGCVAGAVAFGGLALFGASEPLDQPERNATALATRQ